MVAAMIPATTGTNVRMRMSRLSIGLIAPQNSKPVHPAINEAPMPIAKRYSAPSFVESPPNSAEPILGNVMVMNAMPSVIAPTRKLTRSNVVAVSIDTVIIGVFLFC